MNHVIIFQIAFLVLIQHIFAIFGQRTQNLSPTNPCPNYFLRIYNKCYYFSNEYESWDRANFKCADRNSTLAVIKNKNQNNALVQFLKKGYTTEVPRWLGGRYDWKSGQWKWSYNGQLIRYQQFDQSRLRNRSLEWHCLIIDPTNKFSWGSSTCFEKNYYICQTDLLYRKPPVNVSSDSRREIPNNNISNNSTEQHFSDSQPGFYIVNAVDPALPKPVRKPKKPKKKFVCPKNFILVGKKCYFLSHEKETWQDAFYKCEEQESQLAIFKNLNQDKRLRAKVNKLGLSEEQRWIGGQFDWINSVWKWSASGKALRIQPYTPVDLKWACVLWDPSRSDRWTSESCLVPMYYMCQTAAKPVEKRTKQKMARNIQLKSETRNP